MTDLDGTRVDPLSLDEQGLLAHLENLIVQVGALSPADEERLEVLVEKVGTACLPGRINVHRVAERLGR